MNGYSGTVLFRIDKMKKSKAKSCSNCRNRKRRCTREEPSCTFCLKRGLTCNYAMLKEPESDLKEAAKVLVTLNPNNDQNTSNIDSNSKIISHPSTKNHTLMNQNNIINNYADPRNDNDNQLDDYSVEYSESETYNDIHNNNGKIEDKISSRKHDNEPNHKDNLSRTFSSYVEKEMHYSHQTYSYTQKKHIVENESTDNVWHKSKRVHVESSCKENKGLDKTPQNVNHVNNPINNINNNNNVNTSPDILSNLDPTKRVGPVFTTLFNPSINSKERGVEVDINLLINYIPDKTESDILVARYRTSVHPLIPVFDLQLFHPIYEQFWVSKSTTNLSFLVILFTIFYAASVSLFEERTIKIDKHVNKDDLVRQMKYYMGCTEIALSMAEYPRKISTIGLQVSVILYTLVRTDCRTDDFLSISSLVRCAQSLELNRDPSKYHKITDAKELQLRRILWWQVLYLDCTTSLSTRLSPLVDETEFDTQMPNEYKRNHNGDFILDQAIAFFNGRCKWAKCCTKILKYTFKIRPSSEVMMIKITRDIEHLSFFCSSLVQRMLDPINIQPTEEKFVTFSTLVLSTLVDRCHILISILFKEKEETQSTLENSQFNKLYLNEVDDISSVSDSVTVKFNEDVLENHIHLLNEFIKYGEMPRFSIFIWEIRKFQPIQTLLSLLRCIILEILECSVDDKDQIQRVIERLKRSKSVKIIDESIEKLSYLSEHTTALCFQRWNTLFELKNLAWNLLFKKNEKIANPEVLRISGDDAINVADDNDWAELYRDMNEIENLIEENINLCIWDDTSGHYLV